MQQFANVKAKTLPPMGNLYGNSYVVDLRQAQVRLKLMNNEVDSKYTILLRLTTNFINMVIYI